MFALERFLSPNFDQQFLQLRSQIGQRLGPAKQK
jgi:hypothetical protein